MVTHGNRLIHTHTQAQPMKPDVRFFRLVPIQYNNNIQAIKENNIEIRSPFRSPALCIPDGDIFNDKTLRPLRVLLRESEGLERGHAVGFFSPTSAYIKNMLTGVGVIISCRGVTS